MDELREASVCICAGKYKGCNHGSTCTRLAGGRWSPHFCVDCDENRAQYIDKTFDQLMKDPVKRWQRGD